MIDKIKYAAECRKFDKEFSEKEPDFVKWWSHHPHCDDNPKYATPARVAFRCQRYQDEYLEGKQFGLNELERPLSKPE